MKNLFYLFFISGGAGIARGKNGVFLFDDFRGPVRLRGAAAGQDNAVSCPGGI